MSYLSTYVFSESDNQTMIMVEDLKKKEKKKKERRLKYIFYP